MSVIVNPPATITESYEELCRPQQSGSGIVTLTSYESTRYYKCAWADRLTLAAKFAGNVAGAGNGIDIIYTPPQSDPDVPAAVVVRVAIDPFSDKGIAASITPPLIGYDFALLTVTFSTASNQFQEATGGGGLVLTTEDLEPWAEFLTIPNRGLYWAANQHVASEESPPLLVKGMTWVYRTHFQNTVPAAAKSLQGKVNNSQITSAKLGLVFEEETLLFTPPRLSIATDFNGLRLIDIEYRFVHREDGWNKFFNATAVPPAYGKMYTDAAATQEFKPYTPADFTTLTG